MRFKAIGYRVIVETKKSRKQTEGGIDLPEISQEREAYATARGVITDVGKDAWVGFDDNEPWAYIGDNVIFSKHAGVIVYSEDGTMYRIMNDKDILAVDFGDRGGLLAVGHRVLVRPEKVDEKTEGGIFIPDQVRDRHMLAKTVGTLVHAGPQAWRGIGNGEPWAEVGDTVHYHQYGGFVVDDEHGQLRILEDEDLIASVRL